MSIMLGLMGMEVRTAYVASKAWKQHRRSTLTCFLGHRHAQAERLRGGAPYSGQPWGKTWFSWPCPGGVKTRPPQSKEAGFRSPHGQAGGTCGAPAILGGSLGDHIKCLHKPIAQSSLSYAPSVRFARDRRTLTASAIDNEDTLAFSVLHRSKPMIETVPLEKARGLPADAEQQTRFACDRHDQ